MGNTVKHTSAAVASPYEVPPSTALSQVNHSVEITSAPVVPFYEVKATSVVPPSKQPAPSSTSSSMSLSSSVSISSESSSCSSSEQSPESIAPCLSSQSSRSIASSNVTSKSNDKSPVSPRQRPASVKSQSGLRELILPKLVASPSDPILYNFKKRNREEVYKRKTIGIFGNRPRRPQSQFNDFHCCPLPAAEPVKSSSTATSKRVSTPPCPSPFEENSLPVLNHVDASSTTPTEISTPPRPTPMGEKSSSLINIDSSSIAPEDSMPATSPLESSKSATDELVKVSSSASPPIKISLPVAWIDPSSSSSSSSTSTFIEDILPTETDLINVSVNGYLNETDHNVSINGSQPETDPPASGNVSAAFIPSIERPSTSVPSVESHSISVPSEETKFVRDSSKSTPVQVSIHGFEFWLLSSCLREIGKSHPETISRRCKLGDVLRNQREILRKVQPPRNLRKISRSKVQRKLPVSNVIDGEFHFKFEKSPHDDYFSSLKALALEGGKEIEKSKRNYDETVCHLTNCCHLRIISPRVSLSYHPRCLLYGLHPYGFPYCFLKHLPLRPFSLFVSLLSPYLSKCE